MLEHFKGDEIFVKKILDYKTQALDHYKMVLTPFLNPHEQSIVRSVIGNELKVESFGGLINAENERMIICPDFYEINKEDFKISLIEINYNSSYGKLQHKDILGALMHLGIKRDCIGDIYIQDESIYVAVNEYNYSFIYNELKKIKRSSVHLKLTDEEIEIKRDYTKKVFFLSSLRLDKVVSTLFKESRNTGADAIRAGKVKVNYKVIETVNYLCNNMDVISFAHHGRVKIEVTEATSKSGNIVVNGYFYK